jgi:nucleotide-binding universal stress UspA family protein
MSEKDRIVVGFDGSDAAEQALLTAVALCSREAELIVVVAFADMAVPQTRVETKSMVEKEARAEVEHAQQVLAKCHVTPHFRVVPGDPADALIEEVRKEPTRLLVVGRYGRRSAVGQLVGGHLLRLIKKVDVPLVIAPPA